VYRGTIRHRRTAPVEHAFTYDVGMLYLDHEELEAGVLEHPPLWSARRPRAIAGIARADLLGDPAVPLDEAVRALVHERIGVRPSGPVGVLTTPRTLGRVFNPVSFYFCFEDDDRGRLVAVVADVENTPWNERHAYVAACDPAARVQEASFDKVFHVSPLMGMDQRYRFRFTAPGDTLSIHITSEGDSAFDATLNLRREPMTRAGLHRLLARFPLQSARTGALIYANALQLKLKGAPYHAHPDTQATAHHMKPTKTRTVLHRLLRHWVREGELTIIDAHGASTVGHALPHGAVEPLRATVTIHDERAYGLLLKGSLGLAEGYRDGWWDADDLVALVRIAARNIHRGDAYRRRLRPALAPVQAATATLKRNTIDRSKRQISAHYDLGNDLYELMLDETMMYSSAIYPHADASLHEAQLHKLDRICDKLDLQPDDHLLEIGTGWGGLAIHAARRSGCRVTTTTISKEQHALAVERVRAAGLEDRITVLLEDYRLLRGRYDKLVSIEMIEAVGWRDFPTFFRACGSLLADDGVMLLQAITMDDRAYEVEKATSSFINQLIFPGGCLPSVQELQRCVGSYTPLRTVQLEDITPHYVTTLAAWRERFEAAVESGTLDTERYDVRFQRIWSLYLAYCEGGFAERRIQDVQILLAGPQFRGEAPGASREHAVAHLPVLALAEPDDEREVA
jgi:cyclopropane-fatty-acyl-phospholipid synthase